MTIYNSYTCICLCIIASIYFKKITSFILARNQSLQNPALNLFRQGQMHYNRGQDRQAAAAFAKAARLDSNWAAPHLGFGDIFSRQGMSSEAVEAYR